MPELPEVETIRRQLCDAGVQGHSVVTLEVEWPRTVDPLSPTQFRKKMIGKTIEEVSRYGKWLIFKLNGDENMLVHLRMTGGFYLSHGQLKKGPYDRVVFQLSDGLNLHFRDPRKFGRIKLGVAPVGLGPDALEITEESFLNMLLKRKRALKVVLLDQSQIAGIGNIYADEALFQARLHPSRLASTLSKKEKRNLYDAVVSVIRAGVDNGGTSLGSGKGNYVDLNGNSGGFREQAKAYGRARKPCTVCATPLKKITVAQRTTVFCPACQPER